MIRSLLVLAVLLGACTATPIPLPYEDAGATYTTDGDVSSMGGNDGSDNVDIPGMPVDAGGFEDDGPTDLDVVDGLDGPFDGLMPDGIGDGSPGDADGLDTGPAPDWELADGAWSSG